MTNLFPPIHQDPLYHLFANQAAHFGVPNFWNVITNLAFLIPAAYALRAPVQIVQPWKRRAFETLIFGIFLTAFGSAYYHWHPSNATLVWDRLPMTIVFMSIFTITLGERITAWLASKLLFPLLLLGVFSVVYWVRSGDLRLYVLVQFVPLLAMPFLLAFRAAISVPAVSIRSQWLMIAFYSLAKLAEFCDARLRVPIGAHAWKHVLAAIGLFIYVRALTSSNPPPTLPIPANSNPTLPNSSSLCRSNEQCCSRAPQRFSSSRRRLRATQTR